MVWDVLCYVMGGVCILGPLALIFWYFSAARARLKDFHNKR